MTEIKPRSTWAHKLPWSRSGSSIRKKVPGLKAEIQGLDSHRNASLRQHLRATGRSAGVGHLACAAIVVAVLGGRVPPALLAGWMAA